MKRRDFLKLAATSGVAMAAPFGLSGDARALDGRYDGPFLAVFNASGGWDTTYLMDPKGGRDPGGTEINRLYMPGDILTQGNLRFAPTAGRVVPHPQGAPQMTNEDFFARYGAELLVVNGIDVSQNNHTPCSRFMATGELDSLLYPTTPALLAATLAPEVPLGFLTFGNYSATGGVVAQTRIPYLSSLTGLANVDYGGYGQTRPYLHPEALRAVESTLGEVEAAGHSLPRVARARSFVYTAQMDSRTLGRVVDFIPPTIPDGRLQPQVEIALAAFQSGLGVAANLDIAQFDSHANNDNDQMFLIPELLAGVDYMARRAEEVGLRDRIVFVVQSEMGRTPSYNGGNGKDHWSVNSWMAFGPGIAGNRRVGATSFDATSMTEQSAARVDPVTLADRPDGVRIRPQQIHAALRDLFGIASHPLSTRFHLKVPAGEDMPSILRG